MGLHRLGVVRIEFLHFDEPCAVVLIWLENAVDEAEVKMGMLIERGAEPMDEGYRTGSPHWACPRAVIAQVLLDGIEESATRCPRLIEQYSHMDYRVDKSPQ